MGGKNGKYILAENKNVFLNLNEISGHGSLPFVLPFNDMKIFSPNEKQLFKNGKIYDKIFIENSFMI